MGQNDPSPGLIFLPQIACRPRVKHFSFFTLSGFFRCFVRFVRNPFRKCKDNSKFYVRYKPTDYKHLLKQKYFCCCVSFISDANGQCSKNGDGETFRCKCNKGYIGDGSTCRGSFTITVMRKNFSDGLVAQLTTTHTHTHAHTTKLSLTPICLSLISPSLSVSVCLSLPLS